MSSLSFFESCAFAPSSEYVGHRSSLTLYVEVTLEFDGVSSLDFNRLKKELRFFLRDQYEDAIRRKQDHVRFFRTEGCSDYASMTDHGLVSGSNPTIIMSACNISELPADEWKWEVELIAEELGKKFHQFCVLIVYSYKEVKILQKI